MIKKLSLSPVLPLGFCVASILSFLSWILSKRDILPAEANYRWAMDLPSVAKAGFPLPALELPQPPLGSDFIPHEMLGGLIFNEIVWVIVGVIISLIILKRYASKIHTKRVYFLLIPGGFFVFLHLVLFSLWFD